MEHKKTQGKKLKKKSTAPKKCACKMGQASPKKSVEVPTTKTHYEKPTVATHDVDSAEKNGSKKTSNNRDKTSGSEGANTTNIFVVLAKKEFLKNIRNALCSYENEIRSACLSGERDKLLELVRPVGLRGLPIGPSEPLSNDKLEKLCNSLVEYCKHAQFFKIEQAAAKYPCVDEWQKYSPIAKFWVEPILKFSSDICETMKLDHFLCTIDEYIGMFHEEPDAGRLRATSAYASSNKQTKYHIPFCRSSGDIRLIVPTGVLSSY